MNTGVNERMFLVWLYYHEHADYSTIFKDLSAEFPITGIPTGQIVYKLVKKFECTGSVVDALQSGRPCSSCTEENTGTDVVTFIENPQQSAVRVA